MFRAAAVATSFLVADAAKLIMIDSPNLQPSKAHIYIVDTDSGSATALNATVNGAHVYVAGGAVCDNVYYAVYTDIPEFGLVSVDLSSGKVDYLDTDGLFHTIWCGSEKGKLLAIQSNPSPPFSVVTYDIASQASTNIATFPKNDTIGGTDSTFTYNEGANEIWFTGVAANAKPKESLSVANVQTGEVQSFSYARKEQAYAYASFPQGEPAKEGVTFPGMMSKQGSISGELVFSTHTITKGIVQTKIHGDAGKDYAGGEPFVFCGNTVYATTPQSMLVSFDPTTFKSNAPIDLQSAGLEGTTVGGAACMP